MSETNNALPGPTPSGSEETPRPDSPTLGYSPQPGAQQPATRSSRRRSSSLYGFDSVTRAHRAARARAMEEAHERGFYPETRPFVVDWLNGLRPGSPEGLPAYEAAPSNGSAADNLATTVPGATSRVHTAAATAGGAVNPAPAMPNLGSRLMAHTQNASNIPPPLGPAVDSGVRRESLTAPLADQRGSDPTRLAPLLQIPPFIDPIGGSMATLTAHVCCLLWFLSEEQVSSIEHGASCWSEVRPSIKSRVVLATIGFTRWVAQMLTTTQISQNVTFLALHLIYKLRVMLDLEARSGSEYRLMIIAWMLGNKFLDDSTYTNRTWADVSGFGISEINDMEKEFLSGIRYGLFPGDEQWHDWLQKIRTFWTFSRNVEPVTVFPVSEVPKGKESVLPSRPAPGSAHSQGDATAPQNTGNANPRQNAGNVNPPQSAAPAPSTAPPPQSAVPNTQPSTANDAPVSSRPATSGDAEEDEPEIRSIPRIPRRRRSSSPVPLPENYTEVLDFEVMSTDEVERMRAAQTEPSEFWGTSGTRKRRVDSDGLSETSKRTATTDSFQRPGGQLNPYGSDAEVMFPPPPPHYSQLPPPRYSANPAPSHYSAAPQFRAPGNGDFFPPFEVNLPSVDAHGQILPGPPRASPARAPPSWQPGQHPLINFLGRLGHLNYSDQPFRFGQGPPSVASSYASRPAVATAYSTRLPPPAPTPAPPPLHPRAPAPPAYSRHPFNDPPFRAATEAILDGIYVGRTLNDSIPSSMARNPAAGGSSSSSLGYYNIGRRAQQGLQRGPVPIYNTVPGYAQPRPPPPGPPPPPPPSQN